jgi:hypothetical protein
MPRDPQKFAELFGAKLVGEVPDVGGGPFGMARLAHILHQRLTPSQGERPGRPTNPNWVTRCKVPMSTATLAKLARMAEEMSSDQRQVSPMQVAAQLLEDALDRVRVQTEAHAEEIEHDPDDPALPEEAKAPLVPRARVADQETKFGPGLRTKLRDAGDETAGRAEAGEPEERLDTAAKVKGKEAYVEAPKMAQPQERGRKADRRRKKA